MSSQSPKNSSSSRTKTKALEQYFANVIEDRDRLRDHATEREDELMTLKKSTVVCKVELLFPIGLMGNYFFTLLCIKSLVERKYSEIGRAFFLSVPLRISPSPLPQHRRTK